jgi:hypothetical protein
MIKQRISQENVKVLEPVVNDVLEPTETPAYDWEDLLAIVRWETETNSNYMFKDE